MPELVLPPGVEPFRPEAPVHGVLVNDTDLPDEVVATYLEETAGIFGSGRYGGYLTPYHQSTGSLLARSKYRPPTSLTEEIILARDLTERDDDVRSTVGALLAIAFSEGMQNTHEDETVIETFNKVAKHADLDSFFLELYREWLIAGQVTTLQNFTAEQVQIAPSSNDRRSTRRLVMPRIGVVPAELVKVIGNDILGTAPLYYRPVSAEQEQWLNEFFAATTSAGRKAQMRQQDPLLTSMLIEEREVNDPDVSALYTLDNPDPPSGRYVYRLNPRMVARSTMPKGSWSSPKPLMTANFALLEAKRLLNLMDYALLEGGANFLIIAKKGTDQHRALPEEVANLHETMKRASRTGLIIGDHRLDVQIVTPDLGELLNAQKRGLLGRKIAKLMLRIPDFQQGDNAEAIIADVEMLTRVVTLDRRMLRRHVENVVYEEVEKRNDNVAGSANIWFPKIVLQGLNYFNDLVLKLRDRGDIPRKFAVEAGGFDYDHAVAQRKREMTRGDDRVMVPAAVPFDSPQKSGQGATPGAPNDNAGGRPLGARTGAGRSESRRFARRAEAVAVRYDEDESLRRIGEQTASMIEEFSSSVHVGRLTQREREAIDMLAEHNERFSIGALTVVPVNHDYEVGDLKVLRLSGGLSAIVGRRVGDDAILTRALVGRQPDMDELAVEELAVRMFGPEEVTA